MSTDTPDTLAPADKAADKAKDYVVESQQCVLSIIDALLTTWPDPQTPADLAARTEYSYGQCYRALLNLEIQHMATRTGTQWRIGPALTTAAERLRTRTAELLAHYLGTTA